MAFLKKRYGNVWYLIDKSNGKPKWIKLGRISAAEAKTVLSRYNIESTYLRLDLPVRFRVTFKEISEEYLASVRSIKAPGTILHEKSILSHMAKAFGNKLFQEVTLDDLESYFRQRSYAPSSMQLMKQCVAHVYNFAIKRGCLKENLARKITVPRIPMGVPKYISQEIIDKLFANMPSHLLPTFSILYYTGLRPSEMLRLRKQHIDLKKRALLVETSKTGRFRRVPIHPKLVTILEDLIHKTDNDENLIQEWGNNPQITMRKSIMRLCTKLGLPPVTPYQFRHTFATQVLAKTKDLRAVQQLLGHSSITMTTRYATALEERLQEAVNLL